MPRHRDDDHVHDDRPRKSDSTILVVVLVVAGALVLACGGLGAVAVFGWRAAADREIQRVDGQSAKQRQPMTREEFKKAVMGKTPDEVTQAVGRPDQTGEDALFNYSAVSGNLCKLRRGG